MLLCNQNYYLYKIYHRFQNPVPNNLPCMFRLSYCKQLCGLNSIQVESNECYLVQSFFICNECERETLAPGYVFHIVNTTQIVCGHPFLESFLYHSITLLCQIYIYLSAHFIIFCCFIQRIVKSTEFEAISPKVKRNKFFEKTLAFFRFVW